MPLGWVRFGFNSRLSDYRYNFILDIRLNFGFTKSMAFGIVTCSFCYREFLKDNRHINENNKLGHNFYCSTKCQYLFKTKLRQLICENIGCNNKFERSSCHISPHNFCSHSCAAFFNNTKRPKSHKWLNHLSRMKAWKALTKEKRIERKLAGSSLGGKNRWLNYKSQYNRESVILAVQSFVSINHRLPVKREMNKFYHPARKYFGTWNKAIEAAGFKPNPVMFADNCIAKDGHICNSIAEKMIDDYLYEKGISHIRNYPYPEGNYTADFKVGNKLIEYFGLAGEHKRYDEIKRAKHGIVEKFDLHLIEIYPQDLYPRESLDRVLIAKLNTYMYGAEARHIYI